MKSHFYRLIISLCCFVFLAGINKTYAQYCTTNLYFYGCQFGDNINNLKLGTINQVNTGCGNTTTGYSDYSQIQTDLEVGSISTLTVSCGNYGEYISMWVDLNDNTIFEGSEKMVSYLNCNTPNTDYSANFTIPYTAAVGQHKMRVRAVQYTFPIDPCAQYYYGETEDYTVNIVPPSNMSYVSSTTTQSNTTTTSSGSPDVEMIGIQVITSGSLNPLSATSFTLNSNGSTSFNNDVSNVHIYYSGTNSSFSTATLFGSATSLASPITGNQILSAGINYFWVTYDLLPTATIGDYLDAECTQVVLTSGSYSPSVSAPAGNRQINYCSPANTYSCYFAYIDGVELNTLSNTGTMCNGSSDGYITYLPTDSLTTTLEIGSSYAITLTGPAFEPVGMGAWIDFNNDGDFTDANEFVYGTPIYTQGPQTGTVVIPNDASFIGDHKMRVRAKDYGTVSSGESCTLFNYGEAEDYTVTIVNSTPMVFSSATTTQNTSDLTSGQTNAEIIGIQVTTAGSLSPFSLTSLTINSNGSTNFTNDVSNVSIYYSGTSPVFSTATLFGSAANLSAPIAGNQLLAAGTNYFWVTYDLSATATIGDYLDAECTQIVMTGAGGTQVPSPTAPTGSRQINYCIPTTTYGCSSGYIDDVLLNSLSNPNSGCNANANGYIFYAPTGNLTTSLELGSVNTLSLQGPANDYVGFGAWIDYNNDGDFDDADEFVFSSPVTSNGPQFGTVTIPNNSAYLGDHRLRIRSKQNNTVFSYESCGEFLFYNGESEDYTITITNQGAMVYFSSTTSQDNTSPVSQGSIDVEIMGIQVATQGSLTPFNATSFSINSNGSSDPTGDISNIKIYYTGGSPVFATTTLFGSSTNVTNPVISGSQALLPGTNFFWVTYDVSAAGSLGDLLDAECTQITMSGAGGTQVPAVTAPAGYRTIDYCTPQYVNPCSSNDYIDNFTLNTLSNLASGCNGNIDNYIYYPPTANFTTTMEGGQSYDLSLQSGYTYSQGFGVWIDFNNNSSFGDPGEFVYASPFASTSPFYGTITIPADPAFYGERRLRVICTYNMVPGPMDYCSNIFNYGETEDYTVTLTPSTVDMAFVSTTCTQNNLDALVPGQQDAEILGIQIVTSGGLNPFDLTSLTINSNGSTNFSGDVTNVKVYYTGNSSVFAATNLFGSSTTLAAPISGSQPLSSGTNYFWVTYDLTPSAPYGDFLDAECTQVVMTGSAGTQTPAVTAPFGNREINYCVPGTTYGCYYGYINGVTLGDINNIFTGCNGSANGYIQYLPGAGTTTDLDLGTSYTISIDGGPSYDYMGFGVWIDYNNDGDFDDADEYVFSSPFTASGTQTGTITIPSNSAYVGDRRMRVRSKEYSTMTASDACVFFNYYYGETEDYTITLNPPPACNTTPTVGVTEADPPVLCSAGGLVDFSLSSYSVASGLTFQWEQSSDNVNWSNIAGATNTTYQTSVAASTFYRATVTCSNTGQSAPASSIEVEIGGNEQITGVTGGTICGQGTVNLQATGNAEYVLWYADPTGGQPFYSSASPSTYSPYVTGTTTYYTAAATGQLNLGAIGPADYSIGPVYDFFTYNYQYFDVYQECTLTGVYVYPVSAGNVIIEMADQFYNTLQSASVPVTAAQVGQKTFIPLGFSLTPGTGYHLAWSFGSVNLSSNDYSYFPYAYPYTLQDVVSITGSNNGTNYYFYFYDWQIDYSKLCESTVRTPVTATSTTPPVLTITPSPASAVICEGSGASVQLTAAGSYTSYTWSPADGLSTTSGASVSAAPAVSTQYVVTATDGLCTNADTVEVSLVAPPQLTVTSTPPEVCSGGGSQLTASTPALNYNVTQIPFAPDAGTTGITVPLTDDQFTSALPIGFNFNFFGVDYTNFYISSNGFISFDANAGAGCCEGQLMPDVNEPNAVVALAWEDYYPPGGGTISYYTTGTAPYRKLVVTYKEVPHYPSPGSDFVTEQAILYESTNIVEIHTTNMPGNPSATWLGHTEGIENADGTVGYTVPGRNDDNTWTASNDAWRFSPSQYVYSWTPSSSLDNATISAPVATPSTSTTYTVTVTDNTTLCASTGTTTVTILTTPNAGEITTPTSVFCSSGAATLTLDGYSPGATIQWQQSSTSGGPYSNISGATSTTYETPTLTATTYYVAEVICANASVTAEIPVEVNYPPAVPVAIDGGHCGPGTVEIGATGTAGGTLNWYYSETGTNYLGSGSPFTTPFINATTDFWVEDGLPAPPPLTTNYTGFYSFETGAVFDITATNEVYITGFDMNMNYGTCDFEIYYKAGTSQGYETNPSAWIFAGSVTGIASAGIGFPTPIPITLSVHLNPGETYGFYVTSSNYTYMYYSPGTTVGNVAASDNNIQVKEGSANYYAFGYPSTPPCIWNGTVHYTSPGCASPRIPVEAAIYSPQVMASSSDTTICQGESIDLSAQNFTIGDFNYEWSPAIAGMVPQDGLAETVTVTPQVTTTFTVNVSDVAGGCDTAVAINITVNPTPAVFISGLNPQYYNSDPPVTLTAIPAGGTFSGQGVTGNTFSPGSVGLGTYTITYTYTDATTGCTGETSQTVNVVAIEGIAGIDDGYSISLYPNPTGGVFTFDMEMVEPTTDLTIKVFNVVGQPVFSNDFGAVQHEMKKSFDFSEWAAGTYYIQVIVNGKTIYRKVTIQK